MSKLIVILFFLGVSLASKQSETFEPSILERYVRTFAEVAAGTAVAEVREMASRLHQVIAMAIHPDVQRLAKLYREYHHFIHHCDFTSELVEGLQGLPSCFNVTTDLANVTLLAFEGYELVDQFAYSMVDLLSELNECPQEHIWNQIKCYKQAFSDIQYDIKEYTTDFTVYLSNATVVFKDISFDVKNCFSVSKMFSVDWVESKIESCKENLKGQ